MSIEMLRPEVLVPIALFTGLIWAVMVVLGPEKPDWLKNLLERLHGDSTTDPPPPEKKKEGKEKKN